MPTYDYECDKCNHVFEVFLGISELDNVIPKCPKCKSDTHRLVSGGTGVIFKGPGFYCNDYPSPGKCNHCKKTEPVTKDENKNEVENREP